jgi:hypothetical protein
MIKVGNIVIGDWTLVAPMPYAEWRAFIRSTGQKIFSESNYLRIQLMYRHCYDENGRHYHDMNSGKWWLFFYDQHNLFETHWNMYSHQTNYSEKYREFFSKEDAMNHANEFLFKLSKLRMFI